VKCIKKKAACENNIRNRQQKHTGAAGENVTCNLLRRFIAEFKQINIHENEN